MAGSRPWLTPRRKAKANIALPLVSGQASGRSTSWFHRPDGPLVREQRGHHPAVAGEHGRAPRVVLRQDREDLGEPGGDPAVAAAPDERRLGPVVEQARRLLQPREVGARP